MEDLINNYFSFFVEFKYHGVTSKQQCVEKCNGLFGGLPTVSQLDRFSEMVAGKEDWIHLCDPTRTYLERVHIKMSVTHSREKFDDICSELRHFDTHSPRAKGNA